MFLLSQWSLQLEMLKGEYLGAILLKCPLGESRNKALCPTCNFVRQPNCRDFRAEFSRIHLEKLWSELSSAGRRVTGPISVFWGDRGGALARVQLWQMLRGRRSEVTLIRTGHFHLVARRWHTSSVASVSAWRESVLAQSSRPSLPASRGDTAGKNTPLTDKIRGAQTGLISWTPSYVTAIESHIYEIYINVTYNIQKYK